MKKFFLTLAVIGMTLCGSSTAKAGPAFDFDGTAYYQFGDPGNLLAHWGGASPDTGFIKIVNNGPSTFTGNVGFNAIANQGTGFDFSWSYAVTLNPGDYINIALNAESSNFGGYNGPTGAEFFMIGTVDDGSSTGVLNFSIFDRDIHSGVFRTNPFGEFLDNYILQGGTATSGDTGDDFEVSQAPGHFKISGAGNAVPAPAGLVLAGIGGLVMGGFGLRRKMSQKASA